MLFGLSGCLWYSPFLPYLPSPVFTMNRASQREIWARGGSRGESRPFPVPIMGLRFLAWLEQRCSGRGRALWLLPNGNGDGMFPGGVQPSPGRAEEPNLAVSSAESAGRLPGYFLNVHFFASSWLLLLRILLGEAPLL